jgi:hypothetical protein
MVEILRCAQDDVNGSKDNSNGCPAKAGRYRRKYSWADGFGWEIRDADRQ